MRLLLLLLLALVWPVKTLNMILDYTRRLGPYIQRTSGVSISWQVMSQLHLALLHSISPREYYAYGMFAKEARKLLSLFVYDGQSVQLLNGLNPVADTSAFIDKRLFSRALRERGLPAVCTVAWVSDGQLRSDWDSDRLLPAVDLFVKPSKGWGGRGALLCKYSQGGLYQLIDGDSPVRTTLGEEGSAEVMQLSVEELSCMLVVRAGDDELIVQRRLLNHPEIDLVPGGALSSLRILTGYLNDAAVFICGALMIGDVGAVVSHSGLICEVDEETGSLGEAVASGENPLRWTHHPASGAKIRGRVLPMWSAAKTIVLSAHRFFDEHPFVAWDVALASDGVFILEANHAYGTEGLQKPFGRPLLKTKYLDVALYWLDRAKGA